MISILRSESGSMSTSLTIISLILFLCSICCFRFCYFIYEKYVDYKNVPNMASAMSILYSGDNFTTRAYEDKYEFKKQSLDFISKFMSLTLPQGKEYDVKSFSLKKSLPDFDQKYKEIFSHELHPDSFGERRFSDLDIKFTRNIDIPFNKVLKRATKIKMTTSARVSQNFLPLNIVLAIEDTSSNVESFNNKLRPVFLSALRKFQSASSGPNFIKSTLSFIPYTYRVNLYNRCITSISRDDSMDFNFWSKFFDTAFRYDKLQEKLINGGLTEHESKTLVSLSLWLTTQKKSDQYQYKELAEHYSNFEYDTDPSKVFYYKNHRRKKEYLKYFSDYTDSFSDKPPYLMSFLGAKKGIEKIHDIANGWNGSQYPFHFYSTLDRTLGLQSIDRNKYFGDESTCPKETAFFHYESLNSIPAITTPVIVNSPPPVIPPAVEALLYLFRKINGDDLHPVNNNPRYVIFLFVPKYSSENDGGLPFDENGLELLSQTCELYRSYNAYKEGLAVYKIVIVAPNKDSLKPYIDAKCPSKFMNESFQLDFATIEYDNDNVDDDKLENLFLSYLSQEGTVKRSIFDTYWDQHYLPE